jgi:hypothetical protein
VDDEGGQQPVEGEQKRLDLLWDVAAGGWLPITGRSMEPLLPEGCLVRVQPSDEGIPLGSLVLFPLGGALVVHRVVGRKPEGLRTKGDAALRSEPALLGRDELMGLVVEGDWAGKHRHLGGWRWRCFGAALAIHSRLWDLLASPFSGAFLGESRGLGARLVRKLFQLGNLSLPTILSPLLIPLHRGGAGKE